KSSAVRPRAATVKKYKRQLAKVIAETGAEPVSFANDLFTHNLHQLLTELSAHSTAFGDDLDDYLLDLLNETSFLNALSTIAAGEPGASQTLIKVAALDASGLAACLQLRDLYRHLFEKEFNCKVIKSENHSGDSELRTGTHEHAASLVL